MLAKRLAACNRLSTTVSQLFQPQLQKNRHFNVPRPSFFVCPGDAPVAITQNVAWMKRQFSACQTSRRPICLQQFPSYSNCKCKKIVVFTYHSLYFCFLWRCPCDYHAICCMDGKNSMLAKRLAAYTYLPSIVPSYTMLKAMRKSENHYFYHMFVSPGDAPGAITLNVIWTETEFDAYKLSRCMCPSNYNRFWDRTRYWSKIVIFLIHPSE